MQDNLPFRGEKKLKCARYNLSPHLLERQKCFKKNLIWNEIEQRSIFQIGKRKKEQAWQEKDA